MTKCQHSRLDSSTEGETTRWTCLDCEFTFTEEDEDKAIREHLAGLDIWPTDDDTK